MQQMIIKERAFAKAAQDAANKISAASNAFSSMGYGTGLGKAGIMNRYAKKTINPNYYTKVSIRPI